MTVSSVYEPVQYTGNGVTTAFAFPYIFYDDTDIIVTLTLISTGVDTLQVNPTNYTITGGDGATGTVTFVAAPSALYRVTIERSIPYTQEDNYVEGQAFPADTIETAFDRGVMRDQQINATLERVLKYPATDSNSLTSELPSAVDRANKVLSFDADGEPTVTSTDSDNVIAAEAAAAAAEAAQAAAEAAAAMLPLNNYTATAPPTVNDDSGDGYSVGSRWVDTTGDLEAWTCASASVGAAQWLPTTLTVDDLGSLAVLSEVAYANIASAAIGVLADITSGTASKLINAAVFKSWVDANHPRVLLDTKTASSSSQLDFTGIDGTYDTYEFEIIDLDPSADTNIEVRTSSDNGSSYDSGAGNYAFGQATQPITNTITGYGTSNTSIIITGGVLSWGGASAGEAIAGTVKLYKPSGASYRKRFQWFLSGEDTAGNQQMSIGHGSRVSTSAVNAVRFFPSSGNFASGSIKLYGIR